MKTVIHFTTLAIHGKQHFFPHMICESKNVAMCLRTRKFQTSSVVKEGRPRLSVSQHLMGKAPGFIYAGV